MKADEILSSINFKQKRPFIGNVECYLDEGATELKDADLYMMWRDAILANGHTPSRYLTKPSKKDLATIRAIYVGFSEVYGELGFPHFLNAVFANFDEVVVFIQSKSIVPMLFEVHMLGMFGYQLGYILKWYSDRRGDHV